MTDHRGLTPLNIPRVPLLLPSTPQSPSAIALVHTVRERFQELLPAVENNTISNENKTRSLCHYYQTLIPEDKMVFLKMLATDYSVHQPTILQLANQLAATQDRGPSVLLRSEERLRLALIPRYQHFFTQIGRLENGVKFLVDLRADLSNVLVSNSVDHDNPHLQAMSRCLRDLLAMWFSVGFLKLQRITWQSPGDMLQKISAYEAVHPIRNMADLMRRVGPYRRCFVFTHDSMPREPVVVLHSALTNDISSNIQSIVSKTKLGEDANDSIATDLKEDINLISTAIFYSITSTQRGLQGVEMGNYLIKSVVQELQSEFPKIHQFSSLSPIPGFKDWIIKEINRYTHQYDAGESPEQLLFLPDEIQKLEEALNSRSRPMFDALRKTLLNNSWVNAEQLSLFLSQPLLRLCARYLYVEKHRSLALNPVANFHLRNGAMMWRLNWLADISARGLGASCGLMVNYRYFLDQTEENSKNYTENKQIVASDQILQLVAQLPKGDSDGCNGRPESPGSSC